MNSLTVIRLMQHSKTHEDVGKHIIFIGFFCHLSLMFACECQAHDTAGRYLFFQIELGIVLKLQNQQYQGSVQEMWFAVLIKLGQKPIDNRNFCHP